MCPYYFENLPPDTMLLNCFAHWHAGGRIGAVRYSIIFSVVGTTVDYATIKLRPVLKSYKESMLGSNDGKNAGWLKMPDWSPIKVLDEEALAAKQAREKQMYAQRAALGNLSKEES